MQLSMPDSDDILPPAPSLDQLPRIARRIVDASCDIMDIEADSPAYLHAVLCQVGLPRSRVEGRTFHRSSGKVSVLLEAGHIPTPFGKWAEAPLPYGTKPRLVLHYMCSEAVLRQSPQISMDSSMNKFLERLGIGNGNSRDNALFKRQMVALAACHMTLGFFEEGRIRQVKTDPVEKFDAWLPLDVNQRALWDDQVELGARFFETLIEHAVPLDPRAIHALQHSALALDVYTWLGHRLCRVRKPEGVKLSWKNLKEQFGQEYKISKDFKKEFKAALLKVRAVYPRANIEDTIGGLILKPSPPPIPKSSVLVSLPKRIRLDRADSSIP